MAKKYTCKRCGHSWYPRQGGKPHICPNKKCHSYLWDFNRINK
jgi:rubredoxin